MSYLIVTSRCPTTHDRIRGKELVKDNVGGVVTALKRVMEREGGVWVCWGDGNLDHNYKEEDFGKYKVVRVMLNRTEKKGFYEEYSNAVLWPLFHYFREKIQYSRASYRQFKAVNEKFSDIVSKYAEEDMTVWIHDYQLSLVPGMIREKGVGNFSIFTWHIPWVASEFYSILPDREEIIRNISMADMITFHTDLYMSNFRNSYSRIVGNPSKLNGKLYTIPLGIDNEYYGKTKGRRIRVPSFEGRKVIFSIDRLDYSKGLVKRVLAIENLLDRYSEFSGKFVYVMIVTPSRTSVKGYVEMKKELEMQIGRINGEKGNISWWPIIYMYRRISDRTLLTYYRTADIALITPIVDGLNLVSKEFVSATTNGILIISEFAGASYDLGDAIKVNPNDINGLANQIVYALGMGDDEKLERLRKMKEVVKEKDIEWWIKQIGKISEQGKLNDPYVNR